MRGVVRREGDGDQDARWQAGMCGGDRVRSYHGCGGTARGIWFVRTGNVVVSRRYPKNDPKKTRGAETQNHKNSSVKNVLKGNAPEDPSAHSATLRTKKMAKMTPGYRHAVRTVLAFHSVPCNQRDV